MYIVVWWQFHWRWIEYKIKVITLYSALSNKRYWLGKCPPTYILHKCTLRGTAVFIVQRSVQRYDEFKGILHSLSQGKGAYLYLFVKLKVQSPAREYITVNAALKIILIEWYNFAPWQKVKKVYPWRYRSSDSNCTRKARIFFLRE